jgi:hypothetical protein
MELEDGHRCVDDVGLSGGFLGRSETMGGADISTFGKLTYLILIDLAIPSNLFTPTGIHPKIASHHSLSAHFPPSNEYFTCCQPLIWSIITSNGPNSPE